MVILVRKNRARKRGKRGKSILLTKKCDFPEILLIPLKTRGRNEEIIFKGSNEKNFRAE